MINKLTLGLLAFLLSVLYHLQLTSQDLTCLAVAFFFPLSLPLPSRQLLEFHLLGPDVDAIKLGKMLKLDNIVDLGAY